VAASAGAVIGATISGLVSDSLLTYVLAAVAAAAALASFRKRTAASIDTGPAAQVGERIGSLSGAHPSAGGVVPYTVRHLPIGLGLMAVAGVIAGTAGASGGFIKTPATSEIMGVPARVAASTTTFTVGITSSAALVVMALDGRIDPRVSCVVIAGSLVGGRLGAGLQSRLPDLLLRNILGALLACVAIVLVVRA
jgi:uncharacterized protein